MERQHLYISMIGLTEEQIQEELDDFLNEMVKKHKGFGATVLGMTEEAAEKVQEFLDE